MTRGIVYTETVVHAELPGRFSLVAIIAGEDLGCIAKGQGGAYPREGPTAISGDRPVRGLKSKGHPVGAKGVGQICDIAMQIRGKAGELQLAGHSIGNLGGSGATAVVTILGAA